MTTIDKHQDNRQLPISRIPNEILSRIFFILRDCCIVARPWPSSPWPDATLRLDWIDITHVCHHWREVALETPLLWSHINVPQSGRWISELLRRSKQSPLTLSIESLPEELKNHLEHVRKLVLRFPSILTIEQVFSSQSNLPELETLEIFSNSRFILTDFHLHRNGEALRHLTLRCNVNWNSKFFMGLTFLRLVKIPEPSRPSCHDFILLLSKIPTLETLQISDTLFSRLPTHQQPPAKITAHLQHLQRLFVNCPLWDTAQLLSCLIIPRSCQLHIYSNEESEVVCDNLRSILSWVWNQLNVPATSGLDDHDQCIRSFRFVHNPDNVEFEVEGYCDVLSHEQLKTADPILKFVVWWDYCDEFENNIITFFSLLPLDHVAFLEVFADVESASLSTNFWWDAFGKIPTLKTVYLDSQTNNFWPTLNPLDSDSGITKDDQRFLALDSITVIDHFLDLNLVHDSLRVRSALGRQLKSLSFLNGASVYPSPTTMMALLEEVVPHVQVVENESDEDSY